MLVPQVLPPTRTVDLVVIDSAAHLPVEVALAAVARGRQVVVVGDARCASGTAVRALADVLPSVALLADCVAPRPVPDRVPRRARLRRRAAPDAAAAAPAARAASTSSTAPGCPTATTGIVDSTREEVEHVVELVLTHALLRPDESLAVITATPAHAEAVREAVLGRGPRQPRARRVLRLRPRRAVRRHRPAERRRPAPRGDHPVARPRPDPAPRVLHSFGPITAPGGDALLLDALGSTRHRLTVVVVLRRRRPRPRAPARPRPAAARRPARVRRPPRRRVQDVADLVTPPEPHRPAPAVAGRRDRRRRPRPSPPATEPDRLLLDIAERLWKHGLLVEADHGIPGGDRIPLVVGHPDLPGEMLVAVLTDDEEYTAEPSVRVRDRLTADRLERVGWSVVRVWSAAAFIDPQAEVDRIRRAVHARVPAPGRARAPRPCSSGLLDEADDVEDLPTPASSARSAAVPRRAAAHPGEPRPATGVWSTIEVVEARRRRALRTPLASGGRRRVLTAAPPAADRPVDPPPAGAGEPSTASAAADAVPTMPRRSARYCGRWFRRPCRVRR